MATGQDVDEAAPLMGDDHHAGRWLRPAADASLRLLIVGVAVAATFYVAAQLRLVVLPSMLALVMATLLHPPVAHLKSRGIPDGVAALVVLVVALSLVAAVAALILPRAIADFDDLNVSIAGGIDVLQRLLTDGALGVSEDQLREWLDRAEQELRDNAGRITRGAVSGAVLVVEVVAGLVLALVLLFFLLKDGERIWAWIVDLVPPAYRADARSIGERGWATLGGYLRGVTLVALFDAVFIALALVIVGVPLVLPLGVLTFVGAYVPIVGAFVAGLAAVLVALVALGPVAALVVAAAVFAVQQIESNFFQPVVVGRSVRVHPVVILLAVTAGAVLGGILGAIVATPVVAVSAAILRYLRFERREAAPSGDENHGRTSRTDAVFAPCARRPH